MQYLLFSVILIDKFVIFTETRKNVLKYSLILEKCYAGTILTHEVSESNRFFLRVDSFISRKQLKLVDDESIQLSILPNFFINYVRNSTYRGRIFQILKYYKQSKNECLLSKSESVKIY